MLNIAHCITVLFWIYSMSESLESADAALLRRLSAQLAPASGACRCCLQIGGAFGQMPGEVLPVYSKKLCLGKVVHYQTLLSCFNLLGSELLFPSFAEI